MIEERGGMLWVEDREGEVWMKENEGSRLEGCIDWDYEVSIARSYRWLRQVCAFWVRVRVLWC